MKEVIIIAGLPGSGKTTWGNTQVQSISENSCLVDDPSVNPEQWENVTPKTEYLFVADPYFCVLKPKRVLQMLKDNLHHLSEADPANIDQFFNGVVLRWVCMENNLEECLNRARPGVEQFTMRLSKNFLVPDQAQIIPISGYQSPWWTIPQCDILSNFPT